MASFSFLLLLAALALSLAVSLGTLGYALIDLLDADFLLSLPVCESRALLRAAHSIAHPCLINQASPSDILRRAPT